MATKKAPPRRNTDVIRCENCGEEYSTTYKCCPFCDERPGGRSYPPVGGRRVAGGSRSGRGIQANPLQVGGLVLSLVLIIAAVVIVFTTLSPLLFGDSSSGGSDASQSTGTSAAADDVTLESLTLSRTDEDEVSLQAGESYQLSVITVPADAQVTVEWSSSNEDIATVDEYGNITNVYKGSDQVPVTITASAGGQTASCTILCTGDGTGENITSSGGDTTGGGTASGALAPNTDAVITGATGGLNIRSGPGTDYSVQASTSDGATVTVLEDMGNGWYRIEYSTGGGNFEEGYVMGDYLAPSTTQN